MYEVRAIEAQSDRVMAIAAQMLTTEVGTRRTTISNLSSGSAVRGRVRIKHPSLNLWVVEVEVRGSREEAVSIATAVVEANLRYSETVVDERILRELLELEDLAQHCTEAPLQAGRLLPENARPLTIEARAHALAMEIKGVDGLVLRELPDRAAAGQVLLKRLACHCIEDPLLARRLLPDIERPCNIEAMEHALAARNHAPFMIPFGEERFTVVGPKMHVVTHYRQMAFGIGLWTAVVIAGAIIVRRFSNSG